MLPSEYAVRRCVIGIMKKKKEKSKNKVYEMCCLHLFPEINIEHQTDSDIQTQQCGSFKAKMFQWIKKKVVTVIITCRSMKDQPNLNYNVIAPCSCK